MDRGKYLLLFLYTSTPSRCIDHLLHLQSNRHENPWISKCGWKIHLFWDNHVTITYWVKERVQKFTFLKHHRDRSQTLSLPSISMEALIFWKDTVTVNPNKFSSNTIFRFYTWGKFYMVKFDYFSRRPNKVEERFWNIFIWPLCLWY